ncbi:MAG: hypothetical protein E6F96_11310 [Actinobacteria bacterium]|nr:MAG: hypothetical protein E6F96_11310 [Actinomycetota bacterium]
MIDTHLRLLRLIAQRTRRVLEEHDRDEYVSDAITLDRRRRLERMATRAARQVAQAEARRLNRLRAQRS